MTPGIFITLGLLVAAGGLIGAYFWERWDNKRWAKKAVGRIWESRNR